MTRRSYRRDIQPYRIHVQKQDGSHCTFRIKPYVRLTKINKFCKAANNNMEVAKFYFDGMKVRDNETCWSMCMKDGDTLDD